MTLKNKVGGKKMKFISCLVMAVAAMVTMSSCKIEKNVSYGDPKDYAVEVGDFKAIESNCPCTIRFTQASQVGVKLRVAPELRDRFSVATKNGVLYVRSVKQRKRNGILVFGSHDDAGSVELMVSAPDLKQVDLNSAGSFIADNNLHLDALNVNCKGSGDVRLKDVMCNKTFRMVANGAGKLTAQSLVSKHSFSFSSYGSGQLVANSISTPAASFSISGSGDIKAGMTKVGSTNVVVMGSGNANLLFRDCNQAAVNIMGSGNIVLSGSLKSLDQQVSGSGNINCNRLQVLGNDCK